jgi:hypothetical protein
MAAVGFLVGISQKPNKTNTIASKIKAFTNAKGMLFRAIDMVAKP